MASTGLEVFDRTIQETNTWLKRVNERIGGDDRHRAYLVLRAVLHALRDRLGPEVAAHLSAQLPMLVRGIYYEGFRSRAAGAPERHKEEFLDQIRSNLPAGMKIAVEDAARAVFSVIASMIDSGEVDKIIGILPVQIRELWPHVGH